MWKNIAIIFAVCILHCSETAHASSSSEVFTIDDYFKLKRFTELALSLDGGMIAYVVSQQSLDENKTIYAVHIQTTERHAKPLLIDKIQDARKLAWIPRTQELAFLKSDDGVTQLYSINIETQTIRQHTNSADPVTAFQFAPDGESIAWLTQNQPEANKASLYERLHHGDQGVIINSDDLSAYHFVNPELSDFSLKLQKQTSLWLAPHGERPNKIKTPGPVKSFQWSSDASKLSITYIEAGLSKSEPISELTSVAVFDVTTRAFEILAKADTPSETTTAARYNGDEWVPGKNAVFVHRLTVDEFNHSYGAWKLFDFENQERDNRDENQNWHQINPHYYKDPLPTFIPLSENTILSNRTFNAQRFLYRIRPNKVVEKVDFLRDLHGAISLFQFNADYSTAAFVEENFDRPPEVYLWHNGQGVMKLTHVNSGLAEKRLPTFREIHWKGHGGVNIQGWLFEPAGAEHEQKPWPLLTYVHGGPTIAVDNEFAGTFPLWPYPFELYALNGIAVFIPNYRGSSGFGQDFRNPKRIDDEPLDDIVNGITHLIEEGIGDRSRLAISGHSHGAWLASLLMAREKIFSAGAFAEGIPNTITMYNLMRGRLNRVNHDRNWGGSLYENLEHYIEMSADLHFIGLETAVLFEAGVKSLAIAMMSSPKAASNAGMPSEFVIYPKTGHNPTLPSIQREIAKRNLDWFRFWLQGHEDPSMEKKEQYARWRIMRDEQYARQLINSNP